MSKLIDKLIIFIICIAAYIQNQTNLYLAVPVVCAIAVSALMSYFENMISPAVFIAWCGICLVFPMFTYFLPLICYDLFVSKWRSALLAALAPLVITFQIFPINTFIFIALFIAVAYLLRRRTADLEKVKAEYLSLRDTTKEFSMQLESKNKELLEKQDYEINLATLNERNRIARDIHDSIGHMLSNSILQTGALIAVCKDDELKQRLGTLKETLSEGMDSIRDSIHDLHDESVDLFTEVNTLVKGFSFCGISLDYGVESNPARNVKYALLAVMKEALSNIIRHSDATHADITLREHPAFYQLVVHDNGHKKPEGEGIGLKNIAQRVEALNGRVNISDDNGFTVFVTIPKESIV